MQLPLPYLDAAVIEEVPVDLWRVLFQVTGWPASLAQKRESFSHEDVLSALANDNPTDGLLQALEALDSLGTELGREAIVAAMNDRRVPTDTLRADVGEREWALQLYLAQREDALLADVFTRAQMQVQESGEQRRYNEFLGREARRIKGLPARRDKLREEILRFSQATGLGEHVQVHAFEDDGVFVFSVIRSHRTLKPLAVIPGRDARTTIQYRPVHGDVLRYESAIGRLRIAARAATMVEFYRHVLGKVMFDDEFFFDGAPVYSLAVLQEKGKAALDNHGLFEIGRIWMTECLWERGDRNFYQIRSNDCFRSIEELHFPLNEGTLQQAKLKLEVIGKSTRPVTVTIRVPSRIEVSQKSHERLVERALNAIGINQPLPSRPDRDLWSLHPWRHATSVWRSIFKLDTDLMVQVGALRSVRLEAVAHPDHMTAGQSLNVQAIADGEFYGVSLVPEIPSRTLSGTDLEGLELDPEGFRLYMRARLGISRGGRVWADYELLDLGVLQIGDQEVHAFYALRRPQGGVGDHIRARSNGNQTVILFPPVDCDGCELASVMLDSVAPVANEVIRRTIVACGLEELVPAIHSAPEGVRLVIDTRLKQVWIDSVLIGGLQPDAHPYRLIEMLARKSCLSSEEITSQLNPYRQDGSATARQAKGDAKRLITQAVKAAGRDFEEDPFPPFGKGAYRCAFTSFVR
jgi:hypothetical protein